MVLDLDSDGNLRISLGVEVRGGKEHAAARGLPGLWQTLSRLPRERWPTFVRGDCGNGNEAVMSECEERGLPYLFKLRHTAGVKNLVRTLLASGAGWLDGDDGWEAMEGTIKLSGNVHVSALASLSNHGGSVCTLSGATGLRCSSVGGMTWSW